ncbi:MAG: amino acid ABC transporter permease [Alphaproteobacteria bacterium]|nr:amino acid ABC transporter permease [Alphaproteobacteria bacterium]
MDAIIENFFNVPIMVKMFPFLLSGFWWTIKLCLLVVPLGIVSGLAVAMLYATHIRVLKWLVIIYVDFFRSFPPLVLLVFVYYGLPLVGLELPALISVVVAFMLNTSSYYGEIFRAGIESIPRGQWEAARSTGLTWLQTMVHVVVPQAARNVAPDLTSNTLEVMKFTALASVVSFPELLRQAQLAQGLTYNPTPLIMAAGMYLVLLWPIVRLLSRMERRMLAVR